MAEKQEIQKTGEAEIVKVSPRHLGDRQEIAATQNRLLAMMPNAAAYPVEVLRATAQLAVAYRLDPFNGEIYIAKMSKTKVNDIWVDNYAPIIGIKGFRTLARRASNYITQPAREMSQEEVKAFRRDLYDPNDVGVEVSLFRLDVVRECKDLGIPYFPSVGRGFYRINAKAKYDRSGKQVGYSPDNIPETWTAFEVAEKRAEKAAIVKAFDLHVPMQHLVDETFDYDDEMERIAQNEDRRTAPLIDRSQEVIVEEDGDVIYAAD